MIVLCRNYESTDGDPFRINTAGSDGGYKR